MSTLKYLALVRHASSDKTLCSYTEGLVDALVSRLTDLFEDRDPLILSSPKERAIATAQRIHRGFNRKRLFTAMSELYPENDRFGEDAATVVADRILTVNPRNCIIVTHLEFLRDFPNHFAKKMKWEKELPRRDHFDMGDTYLMDCEEKQMCCLIRAQSLSRRSLQPA